MLSTREDFLMLIIREIDEAADTLQLVDQLKNGLPFENTEQLLSSFDDGTIRFRDSEYDVAQIEEYVPEFIYPIEDVPTLVRYAMLASSMMPYYIARDPEDPNHARRVVQRETVLAMIPNLPPEFVANCIIATGRTSELVRRINLSLDGKESSQR